MSDFDDLLGELTVGTTRTTTVTTKTSSYNAFDDDFDPFGSSHVSGQSPAAGGDSSLLLDFSSDYQVTNGDSHGQQTMTSTAPLANPLYDLDSNDFSGNPLYDLSHHEDENQSSYHHEDANQSSHHMTTTTTSSKTVIASSSTSPGNLLYDETYPRDEIAEEESDLLSGTSEHQEEEDEEETYQEQHRQQQQPRYSDSDGQDEVVVVSRQHYDDDDNDDGYNEEVVERDAANVEYSSHEEPSYSLEESQQYGGQQEEDDDDYREYTAQGSVVVKKTEETRQDGRTVIKTTRTETRYSGEPETVDTSKNYSSNHWDEDRLHRNDDFEGDTSKQDIIHFTEMTSTKKVFESEPQAAPRRQVDIQRDILSAEGGVYESKPEVFQQWQNEPEEEGVFENEPTRRPDVVREADKDLTADLPPIGTAQSMRAKFMNVQQESTPQTRREVPPITRGSGGEYVTEPRDHVEKYQGRPESGVFESEPVHNPDVVRSGDEVKEELPERGMAKNLANLFRQKSVENLHQSSSSSRNKRDITPERTTKQVEYVSEPRSHQVQDFQVRVDAGVFENQPQRHADVVTSDSVPEDYVPERGFAKNVAARFRQMETTLKSPPPLSPGRRKEFTPPRQDDRSHQAVVVENHPEVKQDVVHSTDHLEDTLPEQGMAKNIAQLFRQMEAEHKTSNSPTSPRAKKEFTPPAREYGVYENQPKQFQADYNRPSESGVIENNPVKRDDVVRADEAPRYEEELPERGTAKNLVNRWRQMESESVKLKSPSSAGRPKDFTPPREEPRASFRKSQRSSVSSSHGHMDNGSVHPADLPGQYQPQTEASVFESSPQDRPDLVREADSDWADGLPKKDTAKKMLAKFQSIQSEASRSTQGPPLRKDSESSEAEHFEAMENDSQIVDDDDKVGRSKSMRAATQIEKCGACDKTVYAMERLEMNKRVYHKACFRCSQCKAILTPKTFAINNEIIFCTTHYKQLFATKGNYDEGFGRTQHKKLWSSNPNLVKDGE